MTLDVTQGFTFDKEFFFIYDKDMDTALFDAQTAYPPITTTPAPFGALPYCRSSASRSISTAPI